MAINNPRATNLHELAMAAYQHGKDGLLTDADVKAIIAFLDDIVTGKTGNREDRDAA